MAVILKDLARLCIHTITTRPWPVEKSVEKFAAKNIGGISVWREALEGRDIKKTGEMIRETGMDIVSLVRGGFFASVLMKKRIEAIENNKRAIEEAAVLGAPLLVLVCGADPAQSLEESRKQIGNGIEKILMK